MYLKPVPVGTNPPVDEDRIAVWHVISGDDAVIITNVTTLSGQAATPANSKLRFVLAEDRFMTAPYFWEGAWHAGIEEVDQLNHPGLVKVKIPVAVMGTLRRGPYSFSMTVSNRFGTDVRTMLIGTMLVEYEPTSPQHDIPYKDSDPYQDVRSDLGEP